MYRNHFKNYIKWIPAIIDKVISPNTYLINISNSIRFVHKNQIRKSKLDDHYFTFKSNEVPKENKEQNK